MLKGIRCATLVLHVGWDECRMQGLLVGHGYIYTYINI